MIKYRFSGTIKEILSTPSGKEFGFAPDCEHALTEKMGKDEIFFVVLLPTDDKGGIVFKYADKVRVRSKLKSTGSGKVEWTPIWKVGGHYTLVLEKVSKEKDCDIVLKDAPAPRYFKLESVTEKA